MEVQTFEGLWEILNEWVSRRTLSGRVSFSFSLTIKVISTTRYSQRCRGLIPSWKSWSLRRLLLPY